ncbi:MAG: aldehyde dehydrogenase family protein, partial [Alphaproteobacteria bacterium]
MTTFDPFGRQVFIGGEFVAATGKGTFEIANPATLEPVGLVGDCEGVDIAPAVSRANEAQRGWARLDATTRAGFLHKIADSMEKTDPRPLCELVTREMGKPYAEAVGELVQATTIYRYYAELAKEDQGHIAGPTFSESMQFCRYDPYGVSVHIVPYNFPVILFSWTAAASLAAGNAVILKPSELTSLCSLKFLEQHFLHLPPGLVSCVTGGPRVAQALIESDGTHIVAFTGRAATGKAVNEACAKKMKACLIECGGNDPMIISDSAPAEVAAAGSVTSAFHLSGQVCTSSERFYVVDKVHDAFVEEFVRHTRRLRIGNGLGKSEIGPLVSEQARDKAIGLVDEAAAAGAKVACGGRVPPGLNVGWFYEPTILTDVTPAMAIMNDELFGPIAPICRVKDFDEALELANRSTYGLGACVFTTRLDEAMKAAEQLEVGMVWVNNPIIDNDALPFGGRKRSGLGRELGRHGLDAFRQPKTVIID